MLFVETLSLPRPISPIFLNWKFDERMHFFLGSVLKRFRSGRKILGNTREGAPIHNLLLTLTSFNILVWYLVCWHIRLSFKSQVSVWWGWWGNEVPSLGPNCDHNRVGVLIVDSYLTCIARFNRTSYYECSIVRATWCEYFDVRRVKPRKRATVIHFIHSDKVKGDNR